MILFLSNIIIRETKVPNHSNPDIKGNDGNALSCGLMIIGGTFRTINTVLINGIRNNISSSALVPIAIQLINYLNFKFKFV